MEPSARDINPLLRACVHYSVHMEYRQRSASAHSFVFIHYPFPLLYHATRRQARYTLSLAYLEDGSLVAAMLMGSRPSVQDLKDDLRRWECGDPTDHP